MEKENNIHDFGSKTNDNVNIDALIDALFDIRLTLSIKRITKPTISRSELKEIIDKTKNNKDLSVKNAIDTVFDEYLGSFKKQSDSLSLDEMEKMLDNRINYKDVQDKKDKQLSMINNNFQNQTDKAA